MSEQIPEIEADEAVTQRCCPNCKQWYDARAQACYLCGEESPEENYALKKAVETERLNSNLARQMSSVRAEESATQRFRSARNSGRSDDRPLAVNGYKDLVGKIKNSLAESGFGE